MTSAVHFSSARQDWSTPWPLFNRYNDVYRFTLDVCASAENTKCAYYFDEAMDGLAQDWGGETCWMNPPYGREIVKWVRKAAEESHKPGTTVVCLLPSRTDTAWWHDWVVPHAKQIIFLRGRVKFEGFTVSGDGEIAAAKHAAPFPSAIVVFQYGAQPRGEY